MKISIASVLFALSLSACGSDEPAKAITPAPQRESVAMTKDAGVVVQQPVAVAPVVAPPVKVEEPKALPTKFDDALAQGRELAKKGDRDGAKEMFVSAIKLDKKRAEPHMELARIYIDAGEKASAVVESNKAVKLAPNSSVAWNTKGRAELARFSYEDAILAFTKAVELNRDNVWAWNNLGFTELQLKRYDDAANHLSEATTRKGATGYMWNNLGVALEQLDRLDEARHAFEEGGKLGSTDALASRTRLEGVKSVALAHEDMSGDVKATAEAKGYPLNEGQTDEDDKMSGSGSSSDTETK